jgi:hypothetical protein
VRASPRPSEQAAKEARSRCRQTRSQLTVREAEAARVLSRSRSSCPDSRRRLGLTPPSELVTVRAELKNPRKGYRYTFDWDSDMPITKRKKPSDSVGEIELDTTGVDSGNYLVSVVVEEWEPISTVRVTGRVVVVRGESASGRR